MGSLSVAGGILIVIFVLGVFGVGVSLLADGSYDGHPLTLGMGGTLVAIAGAMALYCIF